MSKDIVVELTRAVGPYPKGAELGFASEAKAKQVLGEDTFKVTGLQSREPYQEPRATAPQKGADAPEPAKKA